MNKLKIIILSFLLAISLKGQEKVITSVENFGFVSNIQISESQFKDSKKDKFTIRDYYEFTDASKQGTYKLPSKNFIFVIPPYSKPKISIVSKKEYAIRSTIPKINPVAYKKNDSTIAFKEVQLKDSNQIKNLINNNDIKIIRYFWYRDFYCVAVRVNTHKFNPIDNSVKILKNIKLKFSFSKNVALKQNSPIEYRYKFDEKLKNMFANWQIANQFKTKQAIKNVKDTSDTWINYDADYLKITVVRDGIFKIHKNVFDSLKINISMIDPKTFQLYLSGKEIPIFVNGEDDGVFNDNDFIEFYGHKNYSKISNRILNDTNNEYNELLNRYTDSTFYFLTWNREEGKRVKLQDEFNETVKDSLDYYLRFLHMEKNTQYQNLDNNEVANQMPNWHKNKSAYWNWFGSWSPTKTFNINLENVLNNKSAEVYFKLVSGASSIAKNSHQLILKINGIKIDSQSIDRNDQVLLGSEINSNDLVEGKNSLQLHLVDNGTNPNALVYDWYEIEYPTNISLINDSLNFKVPNDITEGEKVFTIKNVNMQNYIIYKTFPSLKKISNYRIFNNSLYFTDSVLVGSKYSIISNSKAMSPKSIKTKHFKNLRDSKNQGDYIAITNPKFLDVCKGYLGFIRDTYNVNTFLVNVEDIYDEFGYGFPTPQSIKQFLKLSFQYWQKPLPTYLVLIGDATYDYKDYIFNNVGVKLSTNYVPSYGNPVGDNWYVIWDEKVPIPQMEVGRIPIVNEGQLNYYLSKIQNNLEQPFSEWNKRYLFFSGGNSSNSSELSILKNANDNVIKHYIKPKPIAGLYTHFYKTINPQSEFGPYDQEQIHQTISKGGVFISYLGHSGTATWDNGVNATYQLENNVNQNPLMTDYGCSTNKFAEPDIISFGERFLLNDAGQAIGYIGNSSLGFFSTATSYPDLFYKELISDSLHEVGFAHLKSKIALWQSLGGSSTTKIFEFTNCLLGDPIIRLKIPTLPNLIISKNDLDIPTNITELQDSILLKFPIKNLGIANDDTIGISVAQFYNNNLVKQSVSYIAMPEFRDTISFNMITVKHPGKNIVKISIDPLNNIKEIYEDDNDLELQVNVLNLSLRDLNEYRIENGLIKQLKILNPSFNSLKNLNIKLQISDSPEFLTPQEFQFTADSFYTKYPININFVKSRYWYRYKIYNGDDFSFSKSFSTKLLSEYVIGDSLSMNESKKGNIYFKNKGLSLTKDSINFSILSAGWYAGATCVISKNGKNLLPNSFFPGIGIVVVDSLTYNIDTVGVYSLFGQPANVAALSAFINRIPSGKIVLMGVADDARNNMSTALRSSIKSLGSSKIDSLQFRGSWAFIGWKGANPDSVKEILKSPYNGQAIVEDNYLTQSKSGSLLTSTIGPASNWKKLTVSDSLPSDSKINYRILGLKNDTDLDTLNYASVNNGIADLSFLNNLNYDFIKVLAEFNASSGLVSPELKSLGVSYDGVPELGTNYQVVSIDKDTVEQGENVDIAFYVYNVGESTARNFKVQVDVIKPDNSKEKIFEQVVDSLGVEKRKHFDVSYNTTSFNGRRTFSISIDTENKIQELYEDNNYFTIPFFVKGDTTKPSLNITFNGNDIFDGEYISNKPNIKIELNEPSLMPITDTNSVTLFLNNKLIPYKNNDEVLSINYSQTNPKVVVNYTPTLDDGEYKLKVFGKDASGNVADSSGISKSFVVQSKPKILDVYNYPNPMTNDTYFTFKLTQVPDEIRIRIFTIAGRMIKEIKLNNSELHYDLNKIYWDGRDGDGDQIANGTYLYKIIMDMGGKKQTVTKKLAIVK